MTSSALGYIAIIKQATDETRATPDHFIRTDEGGLTKTLNNVMNTSRQNNRWLNIAMKKGSENNEGTLTADMDFNEAVFFFYMTMGTISSADISSLTDGSVYRHTITFAKTLPSFSIEECKGDPAESDNENLIVQRGFGVKGDSLSLKASDGDTLQISQTLQMLGIFDKADMVDDAAAGASVAIALDTVEGLTTSDTVVIRDTSSTESDAIASIDATAETVTIATLGNSYTVGADGKVELAAQTPSYSVEPENASLFDVKMQFAANITAAASASETNVDETEFNIANNINVRPGTKRKGAGRVDAQRGNGQITFKKVFETKAEKDAYLSNAKQACIITISNDKIVSATDTNNAKYQITIKCPNIRYSELTIPTGNDTIYEIEATIEILDDATEGYPLQILVENAMIGTTYTA